MANDILDVRVLRLVGSDGKVCAVFEAREGGASLIQIGNSGLDGGITLHVEESGNCSFSVATTDGYSQFTIDTRRGKADPLGSVAMISMRNAEGKSVLELSAEQDRCSVSFMNQKGQERLTLSVENDQPMVEVVHPDGQVQRVL